jgi:hypothetical protein
MTKQPALVFYSPGSVSSNWWNQDTSTSEGAVQLHHSSDTSFFARAASATTATGNIMTIHYTAVAEIIP